MIDTNAYIHPNAIVEEGATIGHGTRVYAFTHVLGGARIGLDCNLNDHVFIENDVIVGDRVTVKSGVQLWDGIELEDDVFIGPNTTFTNDKFPRSKQYPKYSLKTIVRRGSSIGANATILPGIVIGAKAMVGAGAVVTTTVPPNAIVVGNPARIVEYVDTLSPHTSSVQTVTPRAKPVVNGVRLMPVQKVNDMRGDLLVTELSRDIPFPVKRVFIVHNVPNERIRGEHVHKVLEEFLICLRGSVSIVTDDGKHREEFILNAPDKGLYLPPRVWRTLYKFTFDTVLIVYASTTYDPDDYIRNYDEFLRMVNR